MGDEQTVLDAMHSILASRWSGTRPMAEAVLRDAFKIDPNMSLERLRADLEIAARLRAAVPDQARLDALLGFLLGDNP